MSNLAFPKTYPEARWLDDLDPTGAETASDLESLQQDVFHIIKQRLGSNLADPLKGAGVEDYLSGTSVQLKLLPALIDAQLAQVTRIDDSVSSIAQQPDGSWLITVTITVNGQVIGLLYQLGPNGLTARK